MLLSFKAMTMHALLFQRLDDPFNHAVLLWAVRRDELLLEAVTAHEARVGSRGERVTGLLCSAEISPMTRNIAHKTQPAANGPV